ncbi:MAG TPA: ABC transporter permease [Thermomicrobiales bacterium]|nr:ABC transporter permease [Thermomicrobiales bacterium]
MLHDIQDFLNNPRTDYWGETITYLKLCAVPIALSILIGLVIGVAVARRPVLAFIFTNLSGLARAIPVLAFLAAALPYLGIGFTPSVVALTALGVPPILLNTIAGLRGVDPAIVDAARGMGMTSRQILMRVQAPLVLPVVAAGVRTAAVQIVATAPLAALIGGGGYGDYILEGVNLLRTAPLVVGGVSVAVLALSVELSLAGVQRAVTAEGLRRPVRESGPARQPAIA